MRARDKNLTVLSETEWLALYGLPDFDDFQRAEYFALTDDELALVHAPEPARTGPVPVADRLFQGQTGLLQLSPWPRCRKRTSTSWCSAISRTGVFASTSRKAEYYLQRNDIAALFGYRLWSDSHASLLMAKAAQVALRDLAPAFILTELIAFLNHERSSVPATRRFRKSSVMP